MLLGGSFLTRRLRFFTKALPASTSFCPNLTSPCLLIFRWHKCLFHPRLPGPAHPALAWPPEPGLGWVLIAWALLPPRGMAPRPGAPGTARQASLPPALLSAGGPTELCSRGPAFQGLSRSWAQGSAAAGPAPCSLPSPCRDGAGRRGGRRGYVAVPAHGSPPAGASTLLSCSTLPSSSSALPHTRYLTSMAVFFSLNPFLSASSTSSFSPKITQTCPSSLPCEAGTACPCPTISSLRGQLDRALPAGPRATFPSVGHGLFSRAVAHGGSHPSPPGVIPPPRCDCFNVSMGT